MKQHITIEQLNELSEKGKENLRAWWKPQQGDKCVKWLGSGSIEEEVIIGGSDQNYEEVSELNNGLTPLLSIGQMIEFLEETTDKTYGERWWYKIFFGGYGGEVGLKEEDVELCDALWEVVKEVLEK